ncbi:ribosome production factor 2 homolog [Belonocnema kinseyi]|uniref:ribosome production factor 2 homolog n=1 Tax=Belonocnema kinseyi TaxID=2817044 RepID=UPI00143D77E6|nr:ribosome production factor 2 homolog [Belonocnema kinseyi]
MPVLERVVRPTSHKGKKALLSKEPQLIETAKQTLCIKGSTSSKLAHDCMKDFYDLKKPDAQMMTKKNEIRPFEDISPIERFASKLNSSLFMFTSHNKKRPHNLIMGRIFEHTLLDMVEFGIENYKGLKEFKVPKISTGIKPMLIFNGDIFENNHEYGRIRNLLVDMFHREPAKNIRLKGLEHVISFTARDNKILFRSFRIFLKKSGTRIPRIELEEIGPRADLSVRRSRLASDDLFKQSCKRPKELKVKKKKNISEDPLGKTLGRVHMGAQKLNTIQTRKMKGLRKTMTERKQERKRKSLDSEESTTKKVKSVE